MNSKRPGKGASPTTVTDPKFCRVISRQQRLHTGGLAWNRIPPVAGTDWYATSPTELSGIVFSRRYMQDPHEGPDCGEGPPQPAPCVPDTLNIPDVGTAYLKYTCKDAAKYLRCSRRSWGWDMAEPTCTQSYNTHVARVQIHTRTSDDAGHIATSQHR